MAEHVILFAGPMGAGKTTAIRTLSEIEVVSTEAANTDRETADKETTTVALDYGEIGLGPDDKVRLYGVPGQRRFDFMWTIMQERAMGLILLVHADAPDVGSLVVEHLREFEHLARRGGVVVGISRSDLTGPQPVNEVHAALAGQLPGVLIPIFTVDPRDAGHMRMTLMTLIANIETRTALTAGATE
ncbi:ATP/GTP-binding protein [Salinibacterium sp. SYSU T00001]|uniref:GTP-binding protein n=1 Tax=Homoserinimonas sedimenticola TaxID=2986805 RepID=UPI002235DE94|nr:ATP/GTP-binding protein [Salinibacterium sedimenticola]MCW4386215.1 ATP/GTP-binding protein [Salinibacterium sedimenticola]